MRRPLIVTIIMVVILTAFVIFLMVFSLDKIVTMAVEKYGSEALQAEVTLEDANINVGTGKGILKGIKIANPAGFQSPTLIQVEQATVALDIRTLLRKTVVIRNVEILKPRFTYEIGPQGSNFEVLENNIRTNIEEKGLGGAGADPAAASAGKKLIIKNLNISDAQVQVIAKGTEGSSMTVTLPRIHLAGLGTGSDGMHPEQIAKEVMDALGRTVGKTVQSLNVEKALGAAEKAVEETEKTLRENPELQEKIEKGAKQAGEMVQDLLNK